MVKTSCAVSEPADCTTVWLCGSVLDPQSLVFVNLETGKLPKWLVKDTKDLPTMYFEDLTGENIKN